MDSYGPLCTEFYDLDKPEPPAGALAYYRQRAVDARGPVLEPMCGSGRFLLPLLADGLDVDGTDASPAMLEACRRHAARRGLPVPALFEQPLHALALPRRYRLAFVTSGSIGLIASDDELQASLRALHRHLEPGAALLLELVASDDDDAPAGETTFEPRVVPVDADTTLAYSCRAVPSADRRSVRYDGLYEKRRGDALLASERETLVLRRHPVQAMVALLGDCGFASVRLVEAAAQAWLGNGGCVLVEARR